jgi:hypothetical protein
MIEAIRKAVNVLNELEQTSHYWSDYDVPIGIQDRIAEAKKDLIKEIRLERNSLLAHAENMIEQGNAWYTSGVKQTKVNRVLKSANEFQKMADELEEFVNALIN